MHNETSILPLQASEIPEIGELGRAIWRQHYVSIISNEQIEYMLKGKYSDADLLRYIQAKDRWFDVLRIDGVINGYLRTSREDSNFFKLEEIYLTHVARGKGYGSMLLKRAISLANKSSCTRLYLYVNRHNTKAIDAYVRNGFSIAKSQVFDIGGGFVMDDHRMEYQLKP